VITHTGNQCVNTDRGVSNISHSISGVIRKLNRTLIYFNNQYLNKMETLHNELYFKIAETQSELQSCYRMRYQVYCQEKGWLSGNDFPDGMESDEYDEKAVHVIAYNEEFQPVGTMRILRNQDFDRLPFQDHPGFKGKELKLKNFSELSRFIVVGEKNRNYILKGLIRMIYQTSKKLGIDYWVFVSEPGMIRFLERYRYYFDPLCLPSKYYGGFTLAALCDIRKTEAVWQSQDREALKFNQSESSILTT
jgi:N-acyl-L-homoserine lactone synthetase